MQSTDNKWDYIIVGGGSAGSVLANRLSADSANKVLLLDAGRNDKHLFTRIPAGQMGMFLREDMNWLYESEPDPSRNDRVDMWPAGKIIGGGSAINGMMYVRGHKRDYDEWASLGNTGWSYQDVLPYFQRLEKSEVGDESFRGKSGPQSVSRVRVDSPLTDAFVAAAQEMGIPYNEDYNGELQEGVGYCQATQRGGWRASAAQSYLAPVRSRANLNVQHHAFVNKVLLDDKQAVGVEYQQDGQVRQAHATRGVVLSAGAIATPKVMLLSGIGDESALQKHGVALQHTLPGVGQHLLEHPVVGMSFHVKNARTLTSDLANPFYTIQQGLDYLFRRRGALATCIGHAHALAHTREGLDAPNAQIIFAPLSYELTESGPAPNKKPAVGMGIGLCRVQSEGQIRLRSSRPEDKPVIDYSLLANQDDVDQLVEALRLTRKLCNSEAMSPYFAGEKGPGEAVTTDEQLENYVRESSGLMFHPCGTCKMGVDDLAVVDPSLKVHGLSGLWVADASVFPTLPAGNINASCLMVGEKAADLILQEGKS